MTDQLTSERFLPVEPLRSFLRRQQRIETFHAMAHRWAMLSGRKPPACLRALEKIVNESQRVSLAQVDEVCLFVLDMFPIYLYGDEW